MLWHKICRKVRCLINNRVLTDKKLIQVEDPRTNLWHLTRWKENNKITIQKMKARL